MSGPDGIGRAGRDGTGRAALRGRVAIVAGVARPPGIGRATALRLASAGATVVCADRVDAALDDTGGTSGETFERVLDEVRAVATAPVLGVRVQHGPDRRPGAESGGPEVGAGGATVVPSWESVVPAALAAFGGLDVCCVLTGASGPSVGSGPLAEMPEDALRRCLDRNLIDPFLLARAAAVAMTRTARPGVVVVLSSHAAIRPTPTAAALGAARLALEHLVAAMGEEFGAAGVRVVGVSPLAVLPSADFPNPGLEALAQRAGRTLSEYLGDAVGLGRGQTADETAAVIEFLWSDAASFVSGTTIRVAGGAV